MRFTIKHEIRDRLRIHLAMDCLSFREADTLEYYLSSLDGITKVRVYERTADAVVHFSCSRAFVIERIRDFSFDSVSVPEKVFECSGRETSSRYFDKLVCSVILHFGKRLFLPMPLRILLDTINAVKYIHRGIKTLKNKRIQVEQLDALAISAAMLTGDYNTASSVMFLLKIGDTLEEWTHKRSVDDLARRMSLNIDRVWLLTDAGEVLIDSGKIVCGDRVIVRMGNMIPFDGEV